MTPYNFILGRLSGSFRRHKAYQRGLHHLTLPSSAFTTPKLGARFLHFSTFVLACLPRRSPPHNYALFLRFLTLILARLPRWSPPHNYAHIFLRSLIINFLTVFSVYSFCLRARAYGPLETCDFRVDFRIFRPQISNGSLFFNEIKGKLTLFFDSI